MDGYGNFVLAVAVAAAAGAMLAGAIVRRHAVLIVGVALVLTFLAVFAYLGVDVGAAVAAMTALFVSPLILVAVLLGKGAAKLMNRII